MAQTTIEQFATELKMPSGALLEQLAKAGVAGKKAGDKLSETDKTRLLDYLRKSHGGQDHKKTHDSGRSAQEARVRQTRRSRGRPRA